MEAQRYLADVAAATAAVSEYAGVLGELGERDRPPTVADLRRIAPRLDRSLARVAALQGRLDAARLSDRRPEAQRARAAALLGDVVDAMRRVNLAASAPPSLAGERYAMAAGELAAAVERLRREAEPAES